MKFIHAADLHLDSPFQGLKSDNTPTSIWKLIYSSTFLSLKRIINDAINKKVDFILLSGDLFDNNDRNVKPQYFLYKQFEYLNDYNITVFIILGNHDNNDNISQLDYPNNVEIFNNDVSTKFITTKNKEKIAITGFSYNQRWLTERVISKFPLKGPNVDYQIGMLHGDNDSGKSNYAPFNINELKSKHYDYWALGHIHKRQNICNDPPVYYSGDIQGLNPNEVGEKGYLLVDNDNNSRLNVQFISTSIINWDQLIIKDLNETNQANLVHLILDKINLKNYMKMHFLNIKLEINIDYLNNLDSEILLTQIQNKLRNYYNKYNAWIYSITLVPIYNKNYKLLDNEYWNQSAKDIFNLNQLKSIAPKLFNYDFINSYLSDNLNIKKLKHKTEELLMKKSNGENFNNED